MASQDSSNTVIVKRILTMIEYITCWKSKKYDPRT
jgi:hypothetical protein